MKISNVSIKNFRAIKKQPNIDFKKLTMLIGDNGCSKTTILEAIHYCLSPSFLEDRIKPTDFYIGTDEPIEIVVEFDDNFGAILYDGYDPKEEICRKVFLQIKKRDKASAKAFSDGFVVTHYVVPERDKNDEKGWVLERMGGKSDFKFSERALSFSSGVETKGLPRSFYYNKERDKQVYRGFKTSINRIFEDFNWRFARGLRKENADLEEGQEKFVHRKVAIEKEIKGKVDDKMESTIREMNKKLTSLGLHEVDVSIFDGATPFDSAFLHQKVEELELPISNLGSGVEMIVSLMLLETLSALTKEDFLVIIDEPEMHLHPTLQSKFIAYLKTLSKNNQVIISTHSPYFFKNCSGNVHIELIVAKKEDAGISISNTGDGTFGLFPWSPSWGEINYVAFNLPTIEFHNELYGFLQEDKNAGTTNLIEAFFTANAQVQSKNWIRQNAQGVAQPAELITLMTYIRHSIHHPENPNNAIFTDPELKASIDIMIGLC